MSGDARDFNNIETRTIIKFSFFLQGKAPKEIHAILKEILGILLNFFYFMNYAVTPINYSRPFYEILRIRWLKLTGDLVICIYLLV